MEHSWTEFREVKNPQGGDPLRVQSINRIRLFGSEHQYKVKFNCEDNVGYWYYVWAKPSYFIIEFKASRKKTHARRHCLVQTMENTFELLPPDHPVYQREDVWKHSQEVHQNAYPIVMQRLHVPSLPYEWSDPTKGDGAEKVC